MHRFLASASLVAALVCGVALAGQVDPIVIQNETRIITESGQTFELTVTGISAEVVFLGVTPTKTVGSVRHTGGASSGTFRIRWLEAGKSQEFRLADENLLVG